MRDRDTINFAESIIVKRDGVEDGKVDWTVPDDLPQVEDNSVWYLRLDATLSTAPQVCFYFITLYFLKFYTNIDLYSRCLLSTTLLVRSPLSSKLYV